MNGTAYISKKNAFKIFQLYNFELFEQQIYLWLLKVYIILFFNIEVLLIISFNMRQLITEKFIFKFPLTNSIF